MSTPRLIGSDLLLKYKNQKEDFYRMLAYGRIKEFLEENQDMVEEKKKAFLQKLEGREETEDDFEICVVYARENFSKFLAVSLVKRMKDHPIPEWIKEDPICLADTLKQFKKQREELPMAYCYTLLLIHFTRWSLMDYKNPKNWMYCDSVMLNDILRLEYERKLMKLEELCVLDEDVYAVANTPPTQEVIEAEEKQFQEWKANRPKNIVMSEETKKDLEESAEKLAEKWRKINMERAYSEPRIIEDAFIPQSKR